MRTQKDSSNVEVQSVPPKLYMWNVSEELGTVLVKLRVLVGLSLQMGMR
jgi:hypothetical protein